MNHFLHEFTVGRGVGGIGAALACDPARNTHYATNVAAVGAVWGAGGGVRWAVIRRIMRYGRGGTFQSMGPPTPLGQAQQKFRAVL